MRALTVRQPWASLIVHGPKWIETRSQRTHIRGRIGIVAGMHRPPKFWLNDWSDDGGVSLAPEPWRSYPTGMCEWFDPSEGDDGYWCYDYYRSSLPFGALIGTVELYDCVPIVDDPECSGPVSVWFDPDDEPTLGLSTYDYFDSGWGSEFRSLRDIADQLPYGDFRPGRWAWLLRDPQPCTPVPMRGFQGWREVEL